MTSVGKALNSDSLNTTLTGSKNPSGKSISSNGKSSNGGKPSSGKS